MVINDLHIRRATLAARPYEADSPLLVDPDAELAGAITLQGFETVAPQHAEIIQPTCGFENLQPPVGLSGKALKFTNETTIGKRLGTSVPVA